MSNAIVAKRYAVALFQIAKEKNRIRQCLKKNFALCTKVFSKNGELHSFLTQSEHYQ